MASIYFPPVNKFYEIHRISQDTARDISNTFMNLKYFCLNEGFDKIFARVIHEFHWYNSEILYDENHKDEQKIEILHRSYDSILKFYLESFKQLEQYICKLESMQSRILDVELKRWKKEEELYGYMYVQSHGVIYEYPFNEIVLKDNLYQIRCWCKNLIRIIFSLKKKIKSIKSCIEEIETMLVRQREEIPTFLDFDLKIDQLLANLIKSTFIITRQPNQIMDIINLSAISYVNLLVDHDLGFVDENSFPNIEVSLISGSYVEELLNYENSFSIINPLKALSSTKVRLEKDAYFTGEKIKGLYKQENKLVSSRKWIDTKISITGFDDKKRNYISDFAKHRPLYLLFESKFNVINSMFDNIEVFALSKPIVINFGFNEYESPYSKSYAAGKLAWYNAFEKPSSVLPDKVPWLQVAREIERIFYLETYQSPSKENLQFMAKKAFRNIDSNCQDFSAHSLTWAQFHDELLPEKNFTFWEWLLEIIELSKNYPNDQKTKRNAKYPQIRTIPRSSLINTKYDYITMKEFEKDFKSLFLDHS